MVLDPARRRRARWPAWTWCSRCCTARTARTAPSRACWRWPASRTWARTSSPRRRPWTRSSPRSWPPPRASRSGRTRCCGPACRCPRRTRSGSACRCSSSRRGPARRTASPRSPTGPTWTRRSPPPAQIDPKVLVEAAIVGREIECGVLEGEAGGAPEASAAGRDPRRRPRVLRLRGEVPRRRREYDIPADLPDGGDPPGPGVRPAHVHRAGLRRPGPGRLLRHRRPPRSTSTRSTRCPASRRPRCSR